MNVLALDLGTKTGWAFNKGDFFNAGTWILGSPKEVAAWGKVRLTRRKDPRIQRLCDHVAALGPFDVLIYEDVEFASSRMQAHLWAAFRSAVWLCGVADYFEALPVGTLKKFATGSGRADKAAMSKALKAQHPELWRGDYGDDAVDAIWLHLWAKNNLTRMKISSKV